MSPESARELRRKRVAELRAAEPDMSLRQMAEQLDLSRDTVTRDLAEIDRRAAETAPPADRPDVVAEASSAGGAAASAPVDDSAPQVTGGGRADQQPAGESSAAPVAQAAPPAELPRRMSAERLDVDLRQWPGLRRDLAVLARGGFEDPVDAIVQAVKVLAAGYRQALDEGRIVPGPFVVRDVVVGPPMPDRLVPRRPPPATPAPAGGG